MEIVASYKYLGINIDQKLDWHKHNTYILSKMNQRMYFVRKLKEFNISNTLLSLFYKSTIESLLRFCLIAWGGNSREQDKKKINAMIKKVNKLTNNRNFFFEELLSSLCQQKLNNILADPSHPLFAQIKISVRNGRLLLLKTNTERYRCSFLPLAIRATL